MKVLLHCLFLCYSNQKKWINSVRSNWGKPWISQQYKMTSRNIRRGSRRIKTAPNQRWISSSTTARKYPQNVRKCPIMASTFGMFSQFFSIFRFGEVALEEGPSVHEEGIDDGKILIEVIFEVVRQKVNKRKRNSLIVKRFSTRDRFCKYIDLGFSSLVLWRDYFIYIYTFVLLECLLSGVFHVHVD